MEQSYYQLSKIPFKVIRKANDHFYRIVNPTVIRRNYSYRSDKIIQQSVILDLEQILLISKMHIQPSYPKIIKLEISKDMKNYIVIEKETEIVGGKRRVIDIGSLPARYIKITFLKGCPIMDYSTIEIFGIRIKDIQQIMSEDTMNLIYYQTYDFLYK